MFRRRPGGPGTRDYNRPVSGNSTQFKALRQVRHDAIAAVPVRSPPPVVQARGINAAGLQFLDSFDPVSPLSMKNPQSVLDSPTIFLARLSKFVPQLVARLLESCEQLTQLRALPATFRVRRV
jgi:hypothetical protein